MDWAWITLYASLHYNSTIIYNMQYHEVQVNLQTDQVRDIPVLFILYVVWYQQWCGYTFWENLSGEQA